MRKKVRNGSFFPTLLLISCFPASALTPPSGVVSASKAGLRVTPPPGVNRNPHLLAGETERGTRVSRFNPSLRICNAS